MVSVSTVHDNVLELICSGLSAGDAQRVRATHEFVVPLYADKQLRHGQDALAYSEGVSVMLAQIRADAPTRMAGLLFELPFIAPQAAEGLEIRFGQETLEMISGVAQLLRLSGLPYEQANVPARPKKKTQTPVETVRKMLLAMATDIRVVLIRLALQVMLLRHFAERKQVDDIVRKMARESLDLYSPLANRLGIWQFKWELEDLSFRFLEPDAYKRIAKMLEERRVEREQFIAAAITRLRGELNDAGIQAEVSGRPKHIYSIWDKMRGKSIDFSELYDVRAMRVIVADVKSCYSVLGLVHHLWRPLAKEFDDYISRPKPNGYQSLHTVVVADDGRALEIQIRTEEMHRFAEYGIAAHWRYKESGGSGFANQAYDEKLAWLRQLLAWKSEIADVVVNSEERRQEWVEKLKSASIDDRIYIMTPHAQVIELPVGSTPIDFAYHLHTDIGHGCRGARVDGAMVPLNTALKNAQTVEIITLKGGAGNPGPSRDWLSAGYIASTRTRAKVRAWFNAIDQQVTIGNGRAVMEKTLQRLGKTSVNLDDLAHRLGYGKLDECLLALGKDELSARQIEQMLGADSESRPVVDDEAAFLSRSSQSSVDQGAKSGILVVGTDGLLTQLAKCCRPAPPDDIVGFVTRGKGVSIHRKNCKNFSQMCLRAPERVIQTTWGKAETGALYPVDIFIQANDRQGLLRDITDVLSKEKINVIGVQTQTIRGQAKMSFTAEISATSQLNRALVMIRDVTGVQLARRQ